MAFRFFFVRETLMAILLWWFSILYHHISIVLKVKARKQVFPPEV